VVSPLSTDAKCGVARSAAPSRFDAAVRVASSPPSMPTRIRREALPFFSWSSRTACSGVGADGRNAERSAT